ncbi:hypothetical protein K438DRAFT_1763848 [Mycena galopus ATCC 62051]|nr:hypothetical protein K438DRAFT_1763848 [Mycena galopus ATCC 62051]
MCVADLNSAQIIREKRKDILAMPSMIGCGKWQTRETLAGGKGVAETGRKKIYLVFRSSQTFNRVSPAGPWVKKQFAPSHAFGGSRTHTNSIFRDSFGFLSILVERSLLCAILKVQQPDSLRSDFEPEPELDTEREARGRIFQIGRFRDQQQRRVSETPEDQLGKNRASLWNDGIEDL